MKDNIRKNWISGIVVLALTLVFFTPSTQAQQTAGDLIAQGKAQLFQQTVDGALSAYQTFSQALSVATAESNGVTRCQNPGVDCTIDQAREKAIIHGYLALTRLLDLMLRDDGGDVDTVTELLAQYGIMRTSNDFYTMDFDIPEDYDGHVILPESAPSGEAVRSFIEGPLLTALNASIADMDEVLYYCGIADQFDIDTSEVINAQDIDPEAGVDDPDIEIDEGDYYLFRAGLKAAKAFALTVSAYDLNVDIREIVALLNLEAFNPSDLLDRYPDLLNLLTTSSTPSVDGAAKLAEAKNAMLEAIDDYMTASGKIRNDTTTAQGAEELIAIDDCELRAEEWFRNNLTALKDSLENSTAFQFTDTEETWEFTDTDTGKKLKADFWNDMAAGDWHALTDCDFIGCGGMIDCIMIDGDQITLEFGGEGPNGWTEATFTGTYDSTAGQITNGNYTRTDNTGDFSGTFTATQTAFEPQAYTINFNPFFGAPGYNLRDFLPQFNECGQPVYGTIGYGLNPSDPDATLGGILPGFAQEDWKLEPMPAGIIEIPAATISVQDSAVSDWGTITPVFSDLIGDNDPNLQGSDLQDLYLAKDDQYLYLRMTLADGQPNTTVMSDPWQVMGYFVQFRTGRWEFPGGRVIQVNRTDTGNWRVEVWERDSNGQLVYQEDYEGYAQAVVNDLEFMVPISDLGNLSGKYLSTWTQWIPTSREPSDENETCLRIGPLTTVSGTLSVPNHDGSGPVYIGAYEGAFMPENRVALDIISPTAFSEGMAYTITNVPVGEDLFVVAHWDADFNGLPTPGDMFAQTKPFTTQAAANTGKDLVLGKTTPPAGGLAISGTVTYTGTLGGTLKVVAFYNNGSWTSQYGVVAGEPYVMPWNPTGDSQDYWITGLDPGTYKIFAYIDEDGIGPRAAGEPCGSKQNLAIIDTDIIQQDLTLSVPSFAFSGQEKVYPILRADKGNQLYLAFWAKIPDADGVQLTGPGITEAIDLKRSSMTGSSWSGGIAVSALSDIQTGDYTFAATSAADGSVLTTTFNLDTVPAATPAAATLVSPYEGTPDSEILLPASTPLTFAWNTASDAQAYKLRIDLYDYMNGTWARIYDSGWLPQETTTHTAQMPLPEYVPLRWYVDAYDGAEWASTTAMSRSVRQNFRISEEAPQYTTLSGTVTTGAPGYSVGIIGAEITAIGDAGTFTATTDNSGRWQIPDVPQGTYTITIRAPNHEDLVLSDVNVAGTAVDLGTKEMMFSGAAPTGGVWDINNNGKLDLADIIYGLQVISNMRAQE